MSNHAHLSRPKARRTVMVRIEENTFEPAVLSNAELRFILDHLKEPPNAALHGGVPAGVNPIAITNALSKFQELEQLKQYRGIPWAGFDAIEDSILRYIAWSERSLAILAATGGPSAQGAIPNASQYAFSDDGSAFKFAIGADSAEMPRTEILDDGTRRAFGVALLQPDGLAAANALANVAPWIKRTQAAMTTSKDEMIVNDRGKHGNITCSICGKAEEFDPRVRSKFLAARSRMARHLKSAKDEVSRHRLLYRKVFESRDAKLGK